MMTADGNVINNINVKVKQIPAKIEVNKEYFVVQKDETKQIKVNVLPTNLENKDVNKANRSFVGTKEALWLQKNCYKYGFIIRYPKGKESITGYVYEPWHIRYVGEKAAKEIYESGLCLEEYLGVN